MIIAVNGSLTIEGDAATLLSEASVILSALHQQFADQLGQKLADEALVAIGRMSVNKELMENTLFPAEE